MRRLTLTATILAALTTPTLAQDLSFPTVTFPQPGTFCGPLHLCEPLVTRDTQD